VAIRLAMQAHLQDAEVQQLALHALGTLSRFDARCGTAVLECGALHCIVKALAKHNANGALQVEGAACVGAVGALTQDNQRACCEGHAAGQVIKAARSHPDNADVQEEVLRALGNLSRENAWTSQYIAEAGGVQVITQAMTRLGPARAHPGVALAGAWAIGHMAVHAMQNSSLRDHQTRNVAFTGTGALGCLVVAMQSTPEDTELCAACVFAVCQLARRNHYHQSEIDMSGAVALIRRAMVDHAASEVVQGWGRAALNVTRHDPDAPGMGPEYYVEFAGARRKKNKHAPVTLRNLAWNARRPAEYVIPIWRDSKGEDDEEDEEKGQQAGGVTLPASIRL
jgi:hypothetical protein